MKKLLLGAAITLGAIFSAQAQLPYNQNFETTMTSLPAGWSIGSATYHTGNPGWKFANSFTGTDWIDYTAPHTYCAYVDDVDNNATPVNDYDTLYTGVFSCAAATNVFMSFDLNYNNYTDYEVATIAVSINGGATWTTAVTLPVYGGDVSWHNGMVYDLSSYLAGQANVMVAFTWNCVGAVTNYNAPGWGMAVDNISVYAPADYDMSTAQVSNFYYSKTGTPITFAGTIANWGGTVITSMNMNYSVNGGPAQTDPISSISINKLASYNFTHNMAWTPSTAGNYTVRFWADNLNGNPDLNNSNDTLYAYYTIVDSSKAKMALFEEYMQASCDPCMYAGPNIEPVLQSSAAFCNSFRYHTDWPGLDFMNDETDGLFVQTRVSYYGVDGVPDGKCDGVNDEYPGSVSASDIQNIADAGAVMSIDITSCTYNSGTGTFNVQASIKSYADIPEGMKARVVLSVDTIKYDSNQSDEDPTSSFAAPLGTGTTADSYYPYVRNFCQVAEEMLPNSSGTTLAPYTAYQTQTLNLSWKQNHPWGLTPRAAKHGYDSLFPGEHMTVFIQEDQAAANTSRNTPTTTYPTHSQSGALTTYVYQSAQAPVTVLTGFEELADGVYFDMYPNPTNGNTKIDFDLNQSQNVTVQIYNTLGEQVYYSNQGKMSNGSHTLEINGQELKSGIYFVRFTTDNVTTTKKLVIQR